MLANYEKYQSIWHKNLKCFEHARNKLNRKELNKNYYECKKQADVDMTLQDRQEYFEHDKR